MDEKEERIRGLTRIYYSNPAVQQALLDFALDREVVPRYYEGFGKRPDTLQYKSDIMGLVNKGATSFHASEELWDNPLNIDSEMTPSEMSDIRKSWDLLIDVDSPFLDCSKIAAKLLISALEHHGVKNYGIKFSGNKGFHIIVSAKAFPESYDEQETKNMFPEWPRAICEYLMNYIRGDYYKIAGEMISQSDVLKRTNLSKEDLSTMYCLNCERNAKKAEILKLKCDTCGLEAQKINYKPSKRILRCLDNNCIGKLFELEKQEYYYCEHCTDPKNKNIQLSSNKYPEYFKERGSFNVEKFANLDLVLVAPRHLFRMPYSLHEKTGLSSIVLKKEGIDNFGPRDADPFKVEIKNYIPECEEGEAKSLLGEALDWKKTQRAQDDKIEKKRYENYERTEMTGVTEDMFPKPINKLLKGMEDGKKRGLFILITFLRSAGFDADYINKKIRGWNEKNKPPLKEGYLRGQIDWHLKQRKKILPPNYDNPAFYKDLGLLDEKPQVKNPLVEVARKLRLKKNQ